MEVKINREIQEYQENIFFGLNLRQLVFSALAIAAAVAIYFGLRNVLGTETVSWLCVVGALPFGAMGFVKYNGMSAEEFIGAFVKSEFLTPQAAHVRRRELLLQSRRRCDRKAARTGCA